MRKKRQAIPKMRNGISRYSKMQNSNFLHVQLLGRLGNAWGGCDKASSVGQFTGGGGS